MLLPTQPTPENVASGTKMPQIALRATDKKSVVAGKQEMEFVKIEQTKQGCL
jgi:hypothetical protein